jgi:Chain length determinant protein
MVDTPNKNPWSRSEEEFVMGEYLATWITRLKMIRFHWGKWILISVFFAGVGILYSFLSKPRYQAQVNFVIEENKQSAGGLFSALAGQVGMDLSAVTGSSGLLAGDNVLQLLKSPTLLKKVLLSSHPEDSVHTLAWHYAATYGLLGKYQANASNGAILFPVNGVQGNLGRLQDSLLNLLTKQVLEKELSVYKPDRKLSIFSLEVTNRNEILSQQIALRLIKEAADLYINTKTKRLRINVERLQKKADSISLLLNERTYTTAAANLFNANPGQVSTFANLDISAREKSMLSVVYADLNKSLEINRTALIQETPTIEIIDKPVLPLKKIYWPLYQSVLAGFLTGTGLFILLFLMGVFSKQQKAK